MTTLVGPPRDRGMLDNIRARVTAVATSPSASTYGSAALHSPFTRRDPAIFWSFVPHSYADCRQRCAHWEWKVQDTSQDRLTAEQLQM